jgi:hypothetical protein
MVKDIIRTKSDQLPCKVFLVSFRDHFEIGVKILPINFNSNELVKFLTVFLLSLILFRWL